MPKSVQLQIPEPCHENWNNMTPNEKGRHCGSCCKTVVDFSMMTDKEMVDYISKASHQVCGRFNNDQLNKDIQITEAKKRFSWTYVWNVLLATFLITEANAQVKPAKKKSPVVQAIPPVNEAIYGDVRMVEEPAPSKPVKINGTVIDAETNQPVGWASVMIQQTGKGAATDSLGNFRLSVEMKDSIVLLITCVGYEPQTLVINSTNMAETAKVLLKPLNGQLGEVITVGIIATKYTPKRSEKIKRAVNNWVPLALKKDVKIYPNPVVRGNNMQVALCLKQAGEYKLELLNVDGQVMMVQPVVMQSKQQSVAIPVQTGWSAGIYWIRVSDDQSKNVYQGKVSIQ